MKYYEDLYEVEKIILNNCDINKYNQFFDSFIKDINDPFDMNDMKIYIINEILSIISAVPIHSLKADIKLTFHYCLNSFDNEKSFFDSFFSTLSKYAEINETYLTKDCKQNTELSSFILNMFRAYTHFNNRFYITVGLKIIRFIFTHEQVDIISIENFLRFYAYYYIYESCNTRIDFNQSLNIFSNENYFYYYVDFLLWKIYKKNDKKLLEKYKLPEQISGFDKFSFNYTDNMSIEHFLPRSSRDRVKLSEDEINNIGNLALISSSFNSRLSDKCPYIKSQIIDKSINECCSLKLMVMSQICRDNYNKRNHKEKDLNSLENLQSIPEVFESLQNDWTCNDIKNLEETIINLIKDEVDSFKKK